MATPAQDPSRDFGMWLREQRMSRSLTLREVAAGTEMDQALLSNIERGVRWPSDAGAEALARFFKVPPAEFHGRLVAARIWRDYHVDDPNVAATAAAHVREAAATYGVNKSVNKRTNKK